jgi:hypothetical protein
VEQDAVLPTAASADPPTFVGDDPGGRSACVQEGEPVRDGLHDTNGRHALESRSSARDSSNPRPHTPRGAHGGLVPTLMQHSSALGRRSSAAFALLPAGFGRVRATEGLVRVLCIRGLRGRGAAPCSVSDRRCCLGSEAAPRILHRRAAPGLRGARHAEGGQRRAVALRVMHQRLSRHGSMLHDRRRSRSVCDAVARLHEARARYRHPDSDADKRSLR